MRNSEIRYERVMRDVGWMREGTRRDGVGWLREKLGRWDGWARAVGVEEERYRNHDAMLFSKTHQLS